MDIHELEFRTSLEPRSAKCVRAKIQKRLVGLDIEPERDLWGRIPET